MEKKIFFSLIFMRLLLFISSCEQDETISPSNKEGTYVCTYFPSHIFIRKIPKYKCLI